MTAYLIGAITITDGELLRRYQEQVPPILERYGGQLVAGGRVVELLEGTDPADAAVVLAFDTVDDAHRFYRSEEYAAIRPLRHRAGENRMWLVDATGR